MIIIITLLFVIGNTITPTKVYATKSQESFIGGFFSKFKNTAASAIGFSRSVSGESDWGLENIPGNLLKDLIYLVVSLGDVGMAAMQVTLLGDANFWVGTMLSYKNDNLDDPQSWLYADQSDVDALQNGGTSDRGSMLVIADHEGLKNGIFQAHWKVPNMLYSPEIIFSNKVAALDANYINPHEYEAVRDSEEARREAESFAGKIRPTIASWYRAFRNISIVALLSVLVYIGIRILMGTVVEKAQYKQRLADWFIALCMVFFMHFIMAGIMMISEKITDLFDQTVNSGIIVAVDDGTIFKTSFTGYIRFAAQSDSWTEALGYGTMYLCLVALTLRYTFIYMKRALYIAFFTMIAPLVAITYPIDKAGDGKAQAFNTWFKEYLINALLQPVHLILYSALVGAAIMLVVENPIYGIVALLFISTAEKWIKKMFKMEAPMTATTLSDVALLGSMLNMGKNIVGGIGKTVKLGAIAVATGGAGAAAAGAGEAAGAGAAAAGAEEAAGAEGLTGMLANGAGMLGTGGGGAGSGPSLLGGTVEDVVTGNGAGGASSQDTAQKLEEVDSNNLQYYNDMKEAGHSKNELKQLADDLDLTEYLRQKEAQEINSHTVAVNMLDESAPTPDAVGQTNVEDVATEDVAKQEEKKENDQDKYYKDYFKDKLISKAQEKDEKEELVDMLKQGALGIAGAVPGAMLGAAGAALRGDDPAATVAAGAMAGANTGASFTKSLAEIGDTIFNNNVKIIVKEGEGIKDKDIVKNTAQIAQRERWSEAKMIKVAELAHQFPDLANNKESQKQIQEIMREQGVSEKKLEQVINDVIKTQSGIGDLNKKQEQAEKQTEKLQKNMENWK